MERRIRIFRPVRIEGDIAFVPLTKGKVAIVDAADAHLVAGENWFSADGRYACRVAVVPKRKKISMHHVILPPPEGYFVDHIDGNGLNNRRANLRIATKSQNNWNARRRSDNTSGIKCVIWSKYKQRWQVQINANDERNCLGTFRNFEDARAAYERAVKELHGDFARLS